MDTPDVTTTEKAGAVGFAAIAGTLVAVDADHTTLAIVLGLYTLLAVVTIASDTARRRKRVELAETAPPAEGVSA